MKIRFLQQYLHTLVIGGADSNNNYLPGSAGFLTSLARSNYTVYSRRMAGTGFTPAYTKPYKEIYIDAYKGLASR